MLGLYSLLSLFESFNVYRYRNFVELSLNLFGVLIAWMILNLPIRQERFSREECCCLLACFLFIFWAQEKELTLLLFPLIQ